MSKSKKKSIVYWDSNSFGRMRGETSEEKKTNYKPYSSFLARPSAAVEGPYIEFTVSFRDSGKYVFLSRNYRGTSFYIFG